MKRIFVCLLLLVMCFSPVWNEKNASAETDESHLFVATNEAVVFGEAKLASEHLYTLNHKDEVEIEFDGESAKEYAGDGFVFYHVLTDSKEGYVLCDLVVPKSKFLVTIPKFNAQTNGKATVYFLKDGKYVASDKIVLPKHQRIFLYQGFNRKKQFNAVAFMFEDEVMYGFLEKDVIDPDGVNPIIITVACFAIAAIGVILAIVFLKKKRKD